MTAPLISFSGGLDSTAMLWSEVYNAHNNENPHVFTFYVIGDQGPLKTKRELFSRTRIIQQLNKWYPEVKIIDSVVTITAIKESSFDISNHTPNASFIQPMQWLYGAQKVIDGEKHSKMLMGYVVEDQMTYYAERLVKAWEVLSPICKRIYVPIEMPYVFATKASILKGIDKKLLKLTWTCETPRLIGDNPDKVANIRACGKCTPCIRQRTELLILKETQLQQERETKRQDRKKTCEPIAVI